MLEQIVSGIIQGIVEWLPISSGGILVLIKTRFFAQEGVEELIRQALFLHLGTFLAAFLYFWKDIWQLITLKGDKKLFNFLLVTTIITGLLGYGLLKFLVNLEEELILSSRIITLIIGFLLLITAGLQLRVKQKGSKEIKDLKQSDNILLGVLQGLAVLPGLSRSGLTVAGLLLRKFNSQDALKLSFLMSLPVVLISNIVLNYSYFTFSPELLIGLFFSFVFGLLTIKLLLKIAERINFGYFVLFFGILVLISVFV